MGQLAKIESKLTELGYQILAIGADRPEKLKESIAKHSMTYQLLSDSKMIASRAFGVAYRVDDKTLELYKSFGIDLEEASGEEHHQLPVPTAYVLATDGTIRFRYSNPDYKVRVDPDALLAAAEAALR